MNLADSASRNRTGAGDRGYAMAALLVAMTVMAIVMGAALPTWKQTLQREKEEELIFRGNQYARAINQYQKKNANASPPSIDTLIEQRLLRKKFKDPVSPNEDGEFQPLYVASQAGRQGGAGAVLSTTQSGGIAGVVSKSTAESIRVYNGKNHYNEWQFIALVQSSTAGTTGQGGQGQGRGGTQQQPQPQQGGQQGSQPQQQPQGSRGPQPQGQGR